MVEEECDEKSGRKQGRMKVRRRRKEGADNEAERSEMDG